MSLQFNLKSGTTGCQPQNTCLSKDGCPTNRCPDFVIRRHDTRPPFKVAVSDCNGPFDFRGLIIEVNMWALARLKTNITDSDTYFRLADDVGFEQIMVGDIIVLDRVRLPERMLVTAFDETNKLVQVQRGYHGTTPSAWTKGTAIRIFRVLNAPAQSEMVYEDIQQVDGTTEHDVLIDSYLLYEWQPEDTCLPGCYWLEFKVLKMIDVVWYLPGGYWTGEIHTHTDDLFYTGSSHTDSSVRLSYDQIDDKYYLPDTPWAGSTHIHSDSHVYTGATHDDGSVLLDNTNTPSESGYNEEGVVALATSIIPSFTDSSLTPSDFNCILGEGVEWARRFPVDNEGFLIKIVDSPTTEI